MRNRSGFFGSLVIWGLMGVLLHGCAVNPVTGQQELMLVSEPEEQQMGRQTDQSVVEQYGLYPDTSLNTYLEALGQPMARLSHRPGLNWSFKVMDTSVVNAFAAPGGYIYVTRGLLASMNDEAELAGVLGHEIGHVTARHSARKYSQMLLANLGVGIGLSLAGDYGDVLGPVLQVGTGMLFLKFSRDDERQADALGVEYASRAGFDAGRLADFFTSLERMSTMDGKESGSLPEFFSTHPNPVNRQATVREMAANWQARQPDRVLRVNRQGYLQKIDGLVYGKDPRKGFREENWYYLPEQNVQFLIPAEWSFAREGMQAQMVAPDKKAMVVFEIKQGTSIGPLAAGFVEGMQARVVQSTAGTRAGMPSRQEISVVADKGQQVVIQSDYILGEGQVFVFHGLAGQADFSRLQPLVTQASASFTRIADREKRERQPQRLHIKTIRQPTSLQSALQDHGVDKALWEKVAWLNGMNLDDQLAQDQSIKIVK